MVDGVYQMIYRGAEARCARERHRRAGQQDALRDGLRRRRGDQRDLRRALQSASAQLHRPADPSRRPGVLRHICSRSWAIAPATTAPSMSAARRGRSATPTSAPRMDRRMRSTLIKPGVTTDKVAQASGRRRGVRLSERDRRFRPAVRPRARPRPCTNDRSSARLVSLDHPIEIKEGMVFALETYCPASDGFSAARIEEEVVVTDKGARVITLSRPRSCRSRTGTDDFRPYPGEIAASRFCDTKPPKSGPLKAQCRHDRAHPQSEAPKGTGPPMKNAAPTRLALLSLAGSAAVLGLLGAAALAPAPALAEVSPQVQQACTPDVMRLCNEFVPDVAKIDRLHGTESVRRSARPAAPRFIRRVSGGSPVAVPIAEPSCRYAPSADKIAIAPTSPSSSKKSEAADLD